MPPSQIRVVIADDHHLVRQGIRALLERASDIEVVGEAGDGQQAIELVARLTPQVLVTDIAMPGLNGIDVLKHVCVPGARTQAVILSMYSDETMVRRALRSGARGYLLKRSVTEELLLAVRAASRGEMFLSPEISKYAVADLLASTDEPGPLSNLTSREREVLQLVAEGHTNKEIAGKLAISEKTVEKHRFTLMAKLNVRDVAGLVRFAIKHRLVFLEEQDAVASSHNLA